MISEYQFPVFEVVMIHAGVSRFQSIRTARERLRQARVLHSRWHQAAMMGKRVELLLGKRPSIQLLRTVKHVLGH